MLCGKDEETLLSTLRSLGGYLDFKVIFRSEEEGKKKEQKHAESEGGTMHVYSLQGCILSCISEVINAGLVLSLYRVGAVSLSLNRHLLPTDKEHSYCTVLPVFFAALPLSQHPSVSDVLCYCARKRSFPAASMNI